MNPTDATRHLAEVSREQARREKYEQRADAWEAWLSRRREDEDNDGEPADDDVIVSLALAAIEDLVDQRVTQLIIERESETTAMLSLIGELRGDLLAERKRHDDETASLRARASSLEAEAAERDEIIRELREEVGRLAREIARDRSLARLRQAQRTRVHGDAVVVALAKRRAEKLKEGLDA